MNEHASIPDRADPRVIQLLCGILGVVLASGLLVAIHLRVPGGGIWCVRGFSFGEGEGRQRQDAGWGCGAC